MTDAGKLYIVATPIGNLADISFRAVEVLKTVSLIAAEDTRKTKKLLTHFDIHTPLTSCFEHNEESKAVLIINRLKGGEDCALVSEAGTPSVSDPGYRLISRTLEAGIEIVPIPGPTAAIAALSVSGLPTNRFLFCGFLPDKKGGRRKKLEEVSGESSTLIFYISKWKIRKVVAEMLEVFGDRRCCYCRELTKIHEEVRHLMLSELAVSLEGMAPKGEITLVIEGAGY